jgi:competence protein ComEA
LGELLLPPEGEAWLVGLMVALLLLGALRHRIEPWLAGIAEPPPAVLAAAQRVDPTRFGRVDLNRATAAELASLPRIGPALAARIVADRAARGPFTTTADLDRVRGVGPGILAAIRAEITVGPAAGDTLQAE